MTIADGGVLISDPIKLRTPQNPSMKLPVALSLLVLASAQGEITFKKQTLTEEFVAEGAHFADFDHDGDNDICAGP